jgi:TorA maturation chaperone TorD
VEMESVAALRDFFLARNRPELERAYGELTKNFPEDVPEVEDWEEVEFAFNRLFVGPAALEAPPFASVYLDSEPLVMNETTLEVREMYASIGLESPWKNRLPDDHISLELDATLAMNHIALQSGLAEVQELRSRFLEHMDRWVSRFVDRMNKAPSIHPAIGYAARCLAEWLKHSLENIRGVTGNNGGEV